MKINYNLAYREYFESRDTRASHRLARIKKRDKRVRRRNDRRLAKHIDAE